jgi:hypothetical protein
MMIWSIRVLDDVLFYRVRIPTLCKRYREKHCTVLYSFVYINTVWVFTEESTSGCYRGVLISDNNIGLNERRHGCAQRRKGEKEEKGFSPALHRVVVYTHEVAKFIAIEIVVVIVLVSVIVVVVVVALGPFPYRVCRRVCIAYECKGRFAREKKKEKSHLANGHPLCIYVCRAPIHSLVYVLRPCAVYGLHANCRAHTIILEGDFLFRAKLSRKWKGDS